MAEPDPGFDADEGVLLLGGLGVLVVAAALALGLGWCVTRLASRSGESRIGLAATWGRVLVVSRSRARGDGRGAPGHPKGERGADGSRWLRPSLESPSASSP